MISVKPDPDGCPVADTGTTPGGLTRTNFKLQLQREQLLELERKEQQRAKQQHEQQEQQRQHQQQQQYNLQQQLLFSSASQPLSFSMPSGISSSLLKPTEVPSSILKVWN